MLNGRNAGGGGGEGGGGAGPLNAVLRVPNTPSWPIWLENGLPRVSRLVPPAVVGSSPKIARFGFGGGNTRRGGFGCGATLMQLPGSTTPVTGSIWLARVALTLMFSLLNTRSSGAPIWMSVTEPSTGSRTRRDSRLVSSVSVSAPLPPASRLV